MRIRIAEGQTIAGPHGSARGGDVVDWPEDVASGLIAAKCATPVDPPIEERVLPQPEQAVSRKRKRGKR